MGQIDMMDRQRRLKVLFLSKRLLYPMDTGGKIRTGKMLEKLSKRFDITLVSSVESPQDDPYVEKMYNLCSKFYAVPWKEVPKYSVKFYLRTLWRLLSRYPITVLNDRDRAVQTQIQALIAKEKFDLLICDFVQSSLNFKACHQLPTLLFQHNVEAMIAQRHYERSSHILLKLFWWVQYLKMYRYEKSACQEFNGVVAVSELDQHYMQTQYQAGLVCSIPTGIDTAYFAPVQADEGDGPSVIFTGSMDWLPNEDAILFFAEYILGKIKRAVPDVKVSIVGRNPSPYLRHKLAAWPEIQVVGWVADVRSYIGCHQVYVVPLRIGGGTRIKIYEAMAMGKAIVSTRIGAEGLPVEHGRHALLADEADTFAEAVIYLLQQTEVRRQLGTEAREFVCRHCSWDQAASVFADISESVVKAYGAESQRVMV